MSLKSDLLGGNSVLLDDNTVNVTDFGTFGDGEEDDTEALQRSVNAVRSAGGLVIIPTGTYKVTSAIEVPGGVNVVGSGYSTVLHAAGNHYVWSVSQRNRISGMRLRAASAQSSGGGFDFTDALFNVYIDHIYFDSNMHTGFNVKPGQQGGLYHFDHIRFNGGADMNTGFALGNGTNLVTDIHMYDVIGTASTTADMANAWLDVDNNVDSLNMTDCLFYQGTVGIVLGTSSAAGVSSNHKLTNVVVDSMSSYGINCVEASRLDLTACAVQSSGSATEAGLNIAGGCYAVTMTGGIVQGSDTTGIAIQSGSLDTTINGVVVANNNTTDTASVYGIQASAGATDWAVLNCRSGNNLLGATAGHQKRGLGINTGASDRFRVIGNDFSDNETSGLLNNATGTDWVIDDNLGVITTTVASAATITLPGEDVVKVSGTADITSITAGAPGRRVTIIFTGTAAATGLTDGSNLKLAGSLAYTPDDTISLVCDGTNWWETGRSVN